MLVLLVLLGYTPRLPTKQCSSKDQPNIWCKIYSQFEIKGGKAAACSHLEAGSTLCLSPAYVLHPHSGYSFLTLLTQAISSPCLQPEQRNSLDWKKNKAKQNWKIKKGRVCPLCVRGIFFEGHGPLNAEWTQQWWGRGGRGGSGCTPPQPAPQPKGSWCVTPCSSWYCMRSVMLWDS